MRVTRKYSVLTYAIPVGMSTDCTPARPSTAAMPGARAARAERAVERLPPREKRGADAEEQRRRNRGRRRPEEHGPVEAHSVEKAERPRAHRDSGAQSKPRHEQAERAARRRQ